MNEGLKLTRKTREENSPRIVLEHIITGPKMMVHENDANNKLNREQRHCAGQHKKTDMRACAYYV